MLGSIAASKAARLIATCVCPVVGAGTLTMAVPKVRNAVHKATAPHEYALPKTRERPSAGPLGIAGAPCSVLDTPYLPDGAIASLPQEIDKYKKDYKPPRVPLIFPPETPNPMGPPPDGQPGGGISVPEPHVWLQLLVGFMLVGGSVRLARRAPTEDDLALLERLDELKKDVRP